ncbi:hypothetical protein ANTHELSMS3_01289 [Antarctobacter heliothermus]|uniref:Uncharacterized protein n=1 Tax=Antarctobacter heliothermus TaxID=74033 RepID=A0A222E1D9_9RHOB|nr:hypothetical protein [Antarctobacter heliothermus]ASP20000.1 hypothetical protein ANTHELSMS3_01289 [Antarctobacter heliothermus]
MTQWSRETPEFPEILYPHLFSKDAHGYLKRSSPWTNLGETPSGVAQYFLVATGNSVPQRVFMTERNPIKLDWFFEAVSLSEKEKISVSQLSQYIKGLNLLIGEERYMMLEKILNDSLKLRASSRILLAFARASYPVRSKINGWRGFLADVSAKLESEGKDSRKLLKGMI